MGVFVSGARASGNTCFTRGGPFPLGLLEKGDEEANLVDSFLNEKRTECPLLSRANSGSSLAKYLGGLVLAFPHLKPTTTSLSKNVFEGRSSHASNRSPPPGQGEGRMNTFA